MRYIAFIFLISALSLVMSLTTQAKVDVRNDDSLGGIYGGGAIQTSSTQPIPLNTQITVKISFNATNTYPTSESTIFSQFSFVPFKLYVLDGKLKFDNPYSFFSGSAGTWSTPIATSTWYELAIRYDCSGNDSANPEIWLNGTKRTVTREVAPTVSSICPTASQITIGGFLGSNPFQGYIGDVAIFNGQMNDSAMVTLSASRMYQTPLQYASTTDDWWFQFPDGQQIPDYTIVQNMKGTVPMQTGSVSGFATDYLSFY